MSLLNDLRLLLDQDPGVLDRECLDFWDALTEGKRLPLVLFGAGRLGRKTQLQLDSLGWEVVAFADNDAERWGTSLNGRPILAPETATRLFGSDACFVVCIWRAQGGHSFGETRAKLQGLGARRVIHFGHLARAFPESFLPYYSLDRPGRVAVARDSVLAALDLIDDPVSQETFVRHALWRLTLDFNLLPPPDPREIYFPEDIIVPHQGDVLVDGGAFDGNTVLRFLERWGPRAGGVHAFEPDPENARRFQERFEFSTQRVEVRLHPYALGSAPGTLRFCAEGELSSRESDMGEILVPCLPLDQVLAEELVGLIKLDVEGAEVDVLKGASALLRRERPELAVCLYHTQSHLWEIPTLLHEMVASYRFQLCSHGAEAWDLVLYATAYEHSTG